MTNSCEVDVAGRYGKLTGREAGTRARAYILHRLGECSIVSVNLEGMSLTPSFADECLGLLLTELGYETFQRRIKVINIPRTADPLLQHVLSRRAGRNVQFTRDGALIPRLKVS